MLNRIPWWAWLLIGGGVAVLAWLLVAPEAAPAGAAPVALKAELARRAMARAKQARERADAIEASGTPEIDAAGDAAERAMADRFAKGEQ